MDIFKLRATLGLDSSEYEQGLNDAKDKAEGIGSKLGGAFGGAVKVVGAAIGAATSAVGAFAASSVQVGSTFDSSMAQVAATMGKTVDEIGELRDFAQEMGAKTAFSATQAADALNYMALAGYTADQSMEMLPNVLNLAAAGDMELARASDMVTDAQSALGLEMQDMTGFVDQLAKTASKSNTSVEQLGDAILTVGGTAKNLAGGTTELNTALGILADNGIKGAEGGTKLRNVILSLSAPTDKAAEQLAALGVEAVDANGNFRPLEEIMGELSQSLDGLGTAEKAEIISTIFNKQDIAAVNALLDTSAERWDELSAAIDDSTGAAEAMAATQLDNLAGDITLFQSALEGAKILVSDQLTPSLREFVQFGTSGITQISDAFKEGGLSGAMEAFGNVLSEGLNMIIKLLPTAIDAGMKLLGAVGQGILDNLPTIIDASIQIVNQVLNGVIGALPLLAQGAVEIIARLASGISEMLPTLIPTIVEVVMQIVQTLVDNVPLLLEAAVQLVQGLVEGFINAIPVLIKMLPTLIQSIVDALITSIPILIEGAISLVTALVQAIPTIIEALIVALPQIIEAIVQGLITALPLLIEGNIRLIMALVQALPTIIQSLIKAMPTIIKLITRALIANLPALIQGVTQLIVMLATALPQIAMAIVQMIPQIFTSLVQAIIESAPMILNAIITILASVGRALLSAGSEFVTNVGQTASDILNTVVTWLSQLPEKMAYWAGYAIGSFMKFMLELPGKLTEMFNDAKKNVSDFGTKLWESAKEMAKNFFDSIVNGVKELPNKMSKLGDDLIDAIKNLPEKVMEIGSNIVSGLWDGISNGWSWLTDSVRGLADSLLGGVKDALGIASPSKKFRDEVGVFIDEGVEVGIKKGLPGVKSAMSDLYDLVEEPEVSADINMIGSVDAVNESHNIDKEEDRFSLNDMAEAFVKALDRYGLTVEVDKREFGRVVRKEVMA